VLAACDGVALPLLGDDAAWVEDLVHSVLRQPVKVLVGRKRKCDSFKRENEPQLTVQVSCEGSVANRNHMCKGVCSRVRSRAIDLSLVHARSSALWVARAACEYPPWEGGKYVWYLYRCVPPSGATFTRDLEAIDGT
jgi:hypothetical protein